MQTRVAVTLIVNDMSVDDMIKNGWINDKRQLSFPVSALPEDPEKAGHYLFNFSSIQTDYNNDTQ